MTNKEIQCAILKIGCNDRKGCVHLPKVSQECVVEYKKVLSNYHILKTKGLVVDKLMRGSTPGPLGGDVVITEAGRREYKTRCE